MTLEIITPTNSIVAKLKQAINKKLSKEQLIEHRATIAGHAVRNFLISKFMQSEVYFSLTGGYLRGEFGLTDKQVSKIPDILDDLIHVYIQHTEEKEKGIFKVKIGIVSPADFDPNKHGVFISEKGDAIHWLWWLLTQGTQPVVEGYSVFFKQGIGRSEMAIMVKSEGYNYSIDNYFAGTENDNWITRVVKAHQKEIEVILKGKLNHAS